MKKIEMLLVLLMEECDETSQRASKALRFGVEEVQEGQIMTNSERITYEFCDLVVVMQLLADEGVIKKMFDPAYIEEKKKKTKKWLTYSQEVGTLEIETIQEK